MSKISVNGSNIIVDGISIDLTPYQGQKVTIFRDPDGIITTESEPTHQVAICELEVPAPVITSVDIGQLDSMGQPVMEQLIQPLDLTNVPITVFPGGN